MTSAAFYNINFKKLAKDVMAGELRTPEMIAFISALVTPIDTLYNYFLSQRSANIYRLKHTSQVCYMRSALNDEFDTELRRITIKNAEIKEPLWFYEVGDEKPVHFYEEADNQPVYFREASEFFGGGSDFTVLVPLELKPATETELNAYLIRMRALIDYYKLYCKAYTIEFI